MQSLTVVIIKTLFLDTGQAYKSIQPLLFWMFAVADLHALFFT